jgi:hypothetical protein
MKIDWGLVPNAHKKTYRGGRNTTKAQRDWAPGRLFRE